MARIRIFVEDDVPAVAELFARVYPKLRWSSPAAYESYFRHMLFSNPWYDPEVPSWVAEEGGRIAGFYGLIPRRMLLRGRPIRVAMGYQFFVDPDKRHSLTALELLKACVSGPQDLTFTDTSGEAPGRMWTSVGGAAALLYCLHWIRPLRPARYVLSLLDQRATLPLPLTFAARPLAALADTLAARLRPNRFYRETVDLVEDALDPAAMLAHLPEVMQGYALQPAYDARSLAWLLDQTARKKRYGTLRARSVRDAKRRLIGWYLYHVQARGVSEVVQIAAVQGCFDRVLQRLLADAWRHGAVALRGRLDPRYAVELADRHCWLRREGSMTVVHSRHAEILSAIQQGNAFLSRLEGEWWLRFDDPGEVAAASASAPSTPSPSSRRSIMTPMMER
jgi:hypothetical protein